MSIIFYQCTALPHYTDCIMLILTSFFFSATFFSREAVVATLVQVGTVPEEEALVGVSQVGVPKNEPLKIIGTTLITLPSISSSS